MKLPSSYALVSARTKVEQSSVFARTVPVDLSRIFTGWGPLPAVKTTFRQTGAWDAAGQTRTVQLSDGSEAQEHLTAYAVPFSFAYTVTPRTGPLSLLVGHARGVWWFLPASQGGTEIWWRYEFQPRSAWAWPVLLAVAALWERYMTRALTLLVQLLEEDGGN